MSNKNYNWTSRQREEAAARIFEISGRLAIGLILAALIIVEKASGQTVTKADFAFTNAVDTTQGFSIFGSAPAINNGGTIAFEAAGPGVELGGVWKSLDGKLTTIASSSKNVFSGFGDAITINSFGTVGFTAKVTNGNDSIIAIGDGGALTTIVSARAQGLIGGPFLGISGMNESGTVVFLAIRKGFASQVILAGRGGQLTAVVDTATDPNFSELGSAAINSSGRVVFHGFLVDGTEGIYLRDGGIKTVADTTNPSFSIFLDPVINEPGTAGSAGFLTAGGVEVFSGTALGITARTSPASTFLTSADNVCINNSGDVAFAASEAGGGMGVFIELTGASNPVPVLEAGDPLFGSTLVGLSMGRFSLNNRDQIAFRYQLQDGRAGIAIASRHGQ
jgi:hypothetical protein